MLLVVGIPLTNSSNFFIVDGSDEEQVSQWKWCLTENGYVIRTATPHVLVSDFLLGKAPDRLQWDHKNRNKLDNRRSNFKAATRSENQWNRGRQRNNKSGFKGVSKSGRKWLTQIWVFGKRIHLGYFETAEKAAEVYREAALKYHKAA